MKIDAVSKLEDCFDGSIILGYQFDEAWTREWIFRLRSLGDLDYFSDFPRPFFRLRGPDGLQVKGVEGEDNCRAIFPKQGKETLRQAFEGLFAAD